MSASTLMIGSVRTTKGLVVKAQLDSRTYKTGLSVSDAKFDEPQVVPDRGLTLAICVTHTSFTSRASTRALPSFPYRFMVSPTVSSALPKHVDTVACKVSVTR